ncbi:HET-domain-containing protein [Rhizopogon salebrosus TDB-379]|nr:HET-domain-containing protein [Rhizopogon salebrosus TDB-379]
MKQFHGRRVGQTVDFGLFKSWIHNCENKHGDRCEMVWWRNPGEVLPNTVRVVDVIRMAIIPAPPSCRYVTLSYVWGGPGEGYWTTQANIKQRSVPGGLNVSTLPGTISDSIQLRYLWIDALCIVQDDYKDKAVQIGLMEFFYTSARDPLPGILPGTRDPKQHIAKIQGLHLAVPLPEC